MQAPNDHLDGKALNPDGPSTSFQICAARELNSLQEELSSKRKRQTIPEKIKKEVAYRAWKYGIPEARKWGERKYVEYKFKRETVRDWKFKYEHFCKENITSTDASSTFFSMPRRGRPAILTDELMTEIKQILSNLRVAGCAISRKGAISVGNGVLSSRCPDKMAKNGGNIPLSIKWARTFLSQ